LLILELFTSTKNALLRNCPSIGTATAGGDLILDKCPEVQSVQAGGWLALFGSEVERIIDCSSFTHVPIVKKLLRINASRISITPPPAPKPAPKVEPAAAPPLPPAPPKKARTYCTRSCTAVMLATLAGTAAIVWGYFYRTQIGNNSGVGS
jgi:hypothetical protein